MPSSIGSCTALAKIQSLRDLYYVDEEHLLVNDEYKFECSRFFFIDADYNVYFGRSSTRRLELSVAECNSLLQPVGDEEVYPELPREVTLASNTNLEHLYIKGPNFDAYYHDIRETDGPPAVTRLLAEEVETQETDGPPAVARLLAEEVETQEMLKSHPHPNLVKYHGCVARRGRIAGIVLTKYAVTLEDRIKEDPRPFDAAACMQQIESAVDHLHRLGFAHNDLKPSNIMVDDQDTAVVIDLGSCKGIGQLLCSCGTTGWLEEGLMENDYVTSQERHDVYSLGRIREWIKKERDSQSDLGLPH